MTAVRIAMQVALIWYWFYTYQPALLSVRLLCIRTVIIFGYGLLAADFDTGTLLDYLCDWIVVSHAIGMAMAFWNRDSRFFRHRYGGCQEV